MPDTTDPGGTPPSGSYRERLHVPLRWWVQGTMLVATFWLAFIVSMPAPAAWAATGVVLLAMVALFLGYGAPRVEVADGWLRAGRARISGDHLGAASALDPESTRRIGGVDADARAYLLLRPYLKRAVRVEVLDPADPAPYWLISTRRPDQLASAVGVISSERRTG